VSTAEEDLEKLFPGMRAGDVRSNEHGWVAWMRARSKGKINVTVLKTGEWPRVESYKGHSDVTFFLGTASSASAFKHPVDVAKAAFKIAAMRKAARADYEARVADALDALKEEEDKLRSFEKALLGGKQALR
jgi:hypothetical protein